MFLEIERRLCEEVMEKDSIWGKGQWRLEFFDNLEDYVYEYVGLSEHLELQSGNDDR